MKYALSFLLTIIFSASSALAEATTAANPAQVGASGNMFGSIIPLVLIFAIFYFIMIRPQQKKLKQHQEMLKKLHRGDEIVTSGGIIGSVTKTDDTAGTIEIEIADGVNVKIVRGMVSELRKKGPESERLEKAAKAAEEKKPADGKKPADEKKK